MPASAPPLTENEEIARDVAPDVKEEPLPGAVHSFEEMFFRPCAAAAAAAAAIPAAAAGDADADADADGVAELACCSWRVCFCSSWCCLALFGWTTLLAREGRLFDFFGTARRVPNVKKIKKNDILCISHMLYTTDTIHTPQQQITVGQLGNVSR